jgi:histone H3
MRSKSVPEKRPHAALLAKKKKPKAGSKASTIPEEGGVKKTTRKHRFKPGTVALRGIRQAQKQGGNKGWPKSVIDKICREIASTFSAETDRFSPRALRLLHDAAESFNTDLVRMSSTISLSCKRKTLDVGSMKLASTLMLSPHVLQERDGSKRALEGVLRNTTQRDRQVLVKAPKVPKTLTTQVPKKATQRQDKADLAAKKAGKDDKEDKDDKGDDTADESDKEYASAGEDA